MELTLDTAKENLQKAYTRLCEAKELVNQDTNSQIPHLRPEQLRTFREGLVEAREEFKVAVAAFQAMVLQGLLSAIPEGLTKILSSLDDIDSSVGLVGSCVDCVESAVGCVESAIKKV